ncbi:MAG TPA: hypothetical protein VMH05_14150 [Bryobacteraceae bacterium]|nr:hypothetical protein [Bryobacteraceae bacterium]
MAEQPTADQLFWDHVRHVLRAHLEDVRRSRTNGKFTQARLALELGLTPMGLANFLNAHSKSLGGLPLARACSLGIEFKCDNQRIGRIDRVLEREPADGQLVLEFSDGFQVIEGAKPLSIQLKKEPAHANKGEMRLKIVC